LRACGNGSAEMMRPTRRSTFSKSGQEMEGMGTKCTAAGT
jgi:hypothetical protein